MKKYVILFLLLMLAQPGPSWFKSDGRCYIRTPRFPNTYFYEIPCKYLEDVTVPKSVIDRYLDQCDRDRNCVRQLVKLMPGAGSPG